MVAFTQAELDSIAQLWRTRPPEQLWSGWAYIGTEPDEIWLYRSRTHWRRFPLVKAEVGYVLLGDRDSPLARAVSLPDIIGAIEEIPAAASTAGG